MNKKNVLISLRKLCTYVIILISIIVTGSCSDDENEMQEIDQVDLLSIPGRYQGGFNNTTFGTSGSLSMVVSESNNNTYNVLVFETSNFRPAFNSDGVTPELIGTIDVEETVANIILNLSSDNPICNGEYIGTGTRNTEGRFTLNVTQDETCSGIASTSMGDWSFLKISNETSVP